MTRFRVTDAHEIVKDPGGHAHHWTILQGILHEGTLRVSDALAIPRVGGGTWLGRVLGFSRFQEKLSDTVDAASEAGRVLGVAVWGVAPPQGTVAPGEARVVTLAEARDLVAELRQLEPRVLAHCPDCRRVEHFEKPA